MIYNNRNYPHPVLGIGDDFVKGDITVDLKIASTEKNISITPAFILNNKELMNMIDEKSACYISHIYCRGTLYRKAFRSSKTLSDPILIPAEKLNGEVEADFFICAVSDLTEVGNRSFNPEYEDFKFNIDKGDVIAYAGKGKFFANKVPGELKSISALMNIDCSDKNKEPMYLDYRGEKITIMLSIEDYSNYKLLKNNKQFLGVILSSLVLPSLLEAFHFLEDDSSKDYKKNAWYKALDEYKSSPKYSGPFRTAQMILDNPLSKCFELLTINEAYE
jgi:hypothetical protein